MDSAKEDRSRSGTGKSAVALRPVARVPSLDVLRGVALLGILAVNIQIFSGSPTVAFNVPLRVVTQAGAHPIADYATMIVQWVVFEGKMRALFSLLFGAGCMLILDRLDHKHGPRTAATIFYRRLLWLLVFGLVHGALIWSGDVLLIYAVVGLTLYPLRTLAARRLIQIGLCVALLGGTFGISNALDLRSAWTTARLEEGARDAIAKGARPDADQLRALETARAERGAQVEALASPPSARPSFFDGVRGNAVGYQWFVGMIFTSGWVLETLGLFIAGMGLLKSGFLTARLPSHCYWKIALAGYAVSVAIVVAGLLHARAAGFSSSVTALWMMLPYEFQVVPGALAHAATVMLIVKNGTFRGAQTALAAVGRMAFTNYVLTSIICQSLFAWTGILPQGGVEHYALMLLTAGIWVFILALSEFWLRAFAYGPLEWAWRSLTYGKVQSFVSPTRPLA